ncbi:NAD(P)/FAD-dependent oxidoreductase [Brachybacterium sp. MASK1Z-5]|uniref:NAD(P)/FAD-dependent oxidoreductase n=1 Tax=Brachybacterium halotolerans TaxID=2795215 RepID=A0ABS1B6E3_9MICO|nr:FAD-dependent oxidoreductase [Brachybacterium halotolerans]MBK0330191.1 NAD(P)/FAD-dependent oxidoreductase [Brachybacterium halotolerans]
MREADVVVIGGGQAGLSAGHHLLRRGADVIMLDAEDGPGGAWRHRWDSLTMATVNHIADLPDMPQGTVAEFESANTAVPAYFDEFERRGSLPIERPVRVTSVRSEDPDAGIDSPLRVDSVDGEGRSLAPIRTRAIVNATGTWGNPFVPFVPGIGTFRGRMLRTVDYPGAAALAERRIGIVGGGISATGFLAELSEVATTFWYTRREPVFREGGFTPEIEGRAAVAMVEERVAQGLAPLSVVSVTGLPWSPALAAADARGALARRPMFTRIVPEGVIEADGTTTPLDVLLWATGFRAALDHLAPLHLRAPGGGIRMDGTQVADDPRIHLVGYGPSSSTIGANRAGRAAARRLLRS